MNKKLEQVETIRHSLAHVMAAAIDQIYKGVKFGVGPTIKDGFYYDMLLNKTVSEDELGAIEYKMRELIGKQDDFVKESWSIDQAKAYFLEHKQDFKVELLEDIEKHGTTNLKEIDTRELGVSSNDDKNTTVTVYKTADFVDLCRGPHVANTKEIASVAFKLTKVSGAYWRGDEKRQQLQRIYGVGFETKAGLDEYLKNQEAAKQRDHRKLGRELDLFTFSDLVGSGLPLYTPRGTIIRNELQQAISQISSRYGMQPVSIPHLAKLELYQISGHADKFSQELFEVNSHYKQKFVLKPVNCPHHTQIYAARPRSYRDLPIRYIESTTQYRDEKPGELGGLQRTRGFTVDDGHTFCTVEQIEAEADTIIKIIQEFYTSLGLWGSHWVSLSVRDTDNLSQYIGETEDWEKAEQMLEHIAEVHDLKAQRMEGEAALYGPKLDFMFEDALGRQTQLATIQIDFAMPKRFELSYIDHDGRSCPPVMIHRAILGSFERFVMLLIEHFAGAFPLWLAPEQVRIIPISEKFSDYAKKIESELIENGIRHSLDDANESLGKRIRNAEILKVPYVVVVGEREAAEGSVSIRHYKDGDLGSKKLEDFLAELTEQIIERS